LQAEGRHRGKGGAEKGRASHWRPAGRFRKPSP
jgi:hypothetical protein